MSPKFAQCRLTSQIVAELHMTSQNVSATFGDIMLQLKLSPGAHGTSPGSLIWTKHDLIVRNPELAVAFFDWVVVTADFYLRLGLWQMLAVKT
jgi:hypothetical protein